MIYVRVPAVPVGQPRQRHRVVHAGGRAFASNYTPKNSPVNDYKATLRLAAQEAYGGAPLDGPLAVTLVFVFPSKRKCRIYKATKPDGDNLAKSTLDALNGLTFKDDSQVVDLHILKMHAAADEQPHVEITISPVTIP